MSRPIGKAMPPAPALGVNSARRRVSTDTYAKSYGKSSFEQQRAKQQMGPPLQPAPQETLRRTNSKSAVTPVNGKLTRAPVTKAEPLNANYRKEERSSCDDSSREDGADASVSPMTTPSQSYVPEHRRRGGEGKVAVLTKRQTTAAAASVASSTTPIAAAPIFGARRQEMNANKENINVTLSVAPAGSLGSATAGTSTTSPVTRSHPAHKCFLTSDLRDPLRASNASAASVSSYSASATTPTPVTGTTPNRTSAASSPPNPSLSTTAQPFRKSAADAAAPPVVSSRHATASHGNHSNSNSVNEKSSETAARRVPPPPPPPLRTPSVKAKPAAAAPAAASSKPAVPPVSHTRLPSTATADILEAAPQKTAPASVPPPPAAIVSEPRPPSPDVDWELQEQLSQMDAVLLYVQEVLRALSERRRCAAPPASTDDFRASVVPCRRGGGGGAPSSESTSMRVGASSVALLPDMHKAASGLLSAFTKLEYAQLNSDADVPLLEKQIVYHSTQLARLVDGVERQLSLHETPEVRLLLVDHRCLFQEMHQLVDFLGRMAQQMVLLRALAMQRNLNEAQETVEGFRGGVERQEGQESAASAHPTLFSPLRMMRDSPFFHWLESRWLPAMQAWQQLVRRAQQTAQLGDVDLAIRRSRQEALQIAGLQEVLCPGETISTLHHEQVEVPLQELRKTNAQRRAVMDTLRVLVQEEMSAPTNTSGGAMDAEVLATAVKQAQVYTKERRTTAKEEAQLIQQAEELLQRLQEAGKLQRGIATILQTPAHELVTLLDFITQANDALCQWNLAHDTHLAHVACAVGHTALERVRQSSSQQLYIRNHYSDDASSQTPSSAPPAVPPLNLGHVRGGPPHGPPSSSSASSPPSPPPPCPATAGSPWIGDGFPAGFRARTLYVPHALSRVWTSELSALYRQLCDAFALLFTQRQAQRELEQALSSATGPHGRSVSAGLPKGSAGNSLVSPQMTPHQPPHDVASSPLHTHRSSEDGSPNSGRARNSWDTTSSSLLANTAHVASVDDLQRLLQQAEEAGIAGALVDEARARLRRLQTVRLKIHFDAQTRVLPVADASQASFTDVYAQLQEYCQAQLQQASTSGTPAAAAVAAAGLSERRLRIRYEDSDGDFISLLDQQDWKLMLHELAPDGCAGVKIDLFCDYPILPNSSLLAGGGHLLNTAGGGACGREGGTEDDNNTYVNGLESSTDYEGDEAAGEGKAAVAAPAASPEKRTNVFSRLTSAKERAAAAAANTGKGGNKGITNRPRLRTAVAGGPGASPQAHDALIPRTRPAGPTNANAAATRRAAATVSPTKKRIAADTAATTTNNPPPSSALPPTAELTADNLRRNLFATSPSPGGTDGRPSAETKDSRKSGGASVGPLAPAKAKGATQPLEKPNQQPAPASAAAVTAKPRRSIEDRAKEPTRTNAKTAPAHASPTEPAATAPTKETAATPTPSNEDAPQPDSLVHLNMEAQRRWDFATEAELQLLEIQTRASVATTARDPSSVSRGLDSFPVSNNASQSASAKPGTAEMPRVSRNTFSTTVCSGKQAATQLPTAPAEDVGVETVTGATRAESRRDMTWSVPFADTPPKSSSAAARPVQRNGRSPSPPRRVPKRWTTDEFSLDDVQTVCSDRSRMPLQSAGPPKGPATLPPRPQTAAAGGGAGSPNANGGTTRTPQRGRRGARGTPTRSRPESGEDAMDAAEDGEGNGEISNDVFAEMQRMRDENNRAMQQSRKAAWH